MLNVLDVCVNYLGGTGIPSKLAYIIALAVKIIQIGVPLLLIVWGMMDLGKAVMAQKEDEIKKGQNTFIKRLVAAAIVFFVVVIVKLLVGLVADNNENHNISSCIDSVLKCNSMDCVDAAE